MRENPHYMVKQHRDSNNAIYLDFCACSSRSFYHRRQKKC